MHSQSRRSFSNFTGATFYFADQETLRPEKLVTPIAGPDLGTFRSDGPMSRHFQVTDKVAAPSGGGQGRGTFR